MQYSTTYLKIFFYDGEEVMRVTYNNDPDYQPDISGSTIVWLHWSGVAGEGGVYMGTYDPQRAANMSGYEDGTENPIGDDAVKTAIVQGEGEGLDGGSFVTVQQWLHDFELFDLMTTKEQDDAIGRHISNNEEFDEAPESAHVKRSAQESFDPEAFMLRRSMPWAEAMQSGLMFVAFGHSFDAFEAIQNRMLGHDDGILDGLFTFTRPITGAYYWCPPIKEDKLDLSQLGL